MPKAIAAPWSLGVAFLSSHPEHRFLFEILDHAGLAYVTADASEGPAALTGCRVWLVVCGERAGVAPEWRQAVLHHIQQGGAVLVAGNPAGLEDILGIEPLRPCNIGEGYLEPDGDWPLVFDDVPNRPLHFFSAWAARALPGTPALGRALDAHAQRTDHTLGVRPAPKIAGVFVDIPSTVRRITHGIPVVVDGVPAPDGSAPLDDNILKAEDGHVLDWVLDRRDPCEAGFGFFAGAVADIWREVLLASIFSVAEAAEAPLKLIWYYPDELKALGHLSFDTDENDPNLARELIRILDAVKLRGTWFVIDPGYPLDSGVIEQVKSHGHEVGFHFNGGIAPASRAADWSFDKFQEQFRRVAEACGVEGFCSNKNHYTRWQNATDILEWCSRLGIGVDESKLPSKPGTLGFFSGTCHPWYHHDPLGEPIHCLEIAGFSQDPVVTVPPKTGIALLQAAVNRCGIASFTFHPAHIAKPGVAQALEDLVAAGRSLGVEWWTAKEIAAWEQARRAVTFDGGGGIYGGDSPSGRHVTTLTLDSGGAFRYAGFAFRGASAA